MEDYVKLGIEQAIKISTLSRCNSRKVGACIYFNKLFYGFNHNEGCCDEECETIEFLCSDKTCNYKTTNPIEVWCQRCGHFLGSVNESSNNSVVHAEEHLLKKHGNELKKIYKETGKKVNLFITDAPCLKCANLIVKNGFIGRVFYLRKFTNEDGIKYLLKNNIDIKQVDIERIEPSLRKLLTLRGQ